MNQDDERKKARAALQLAISEMPDEAFSWLALAAMPRLYGPQIWPDGLGGFSDESRRCIVAAAMAASAYTQQPIKEHTDASFYANAFKNKTKG